MDIKALILSSVLILLLILYGLIASKSDVKNREVKVLPLLIGILVTFVLAIITLIKSGSQIPYLTVSFIGAVVLSIVPGVFRWYAFGDVFLYLIGANIFAVSSKVTNENNIGFYVIGMVVSYIFQFVYIIVRYEQRKKQVMSEDEAKEEVVKEGVEFFPGITLGNIVATVLLVIFRFFK